EGKQKVQVMIDIEVQQRQVENGHHHGHAGIEFVLKDHRYPVTEDVPENTAENTGDHARHDHYRQGVIQLHGDIAANYGEGDQSHGIQHQEHLVQVMHVAGNDHGKKTRQDGE